ncbi:hypothetical protein SAMN04487911_12840 [Arenibacter nanhaiticus]|uniref:Uncharacterized protein n=1 Tax=Arenibacter nanhaiticus TaxID=558155 RepID=A0A1M6KY04_9FLAO|nr:hypothetical protein [Arenibacter nanhaiticus]SHJ63799.1 hypothetical protein SAMN04487911_12840 [Arenibacter nanhaiticus]
MDSKDWLLEQLKVAYQKSDISQTGAFIDLVDIPYKGISIKHSNGLYISFKHFDLVEFYALSIYLESRIKQEDIRVYCKEYDKSIWVYFDKKFTEGSKGDFEKAMWTFKIIDNLIKDITNVVIKVGSDEVK